MLPDTTEEALAGVLMITGSGPLGCRGVAGLGEPKGLDIEALSDRTRELWWSMAFGVAMLLPPKVQTDISCVSPECWFTSSTVVAVAVKRRCATRAAARSGD